MVKAIEAFAKFIATSPNWASEEVRSAVRPVLIDTLGCLMVGSRQPVSKRTLAGLTGFGEGRCRVYGTGIALPAPFAALANGTAAHALELDDWEEPGNTHPSAVIIPALLATAENYGQPMTGSDLIDAYVVGLEATVRIGEAVNYEHYNRGWHSTGTIAAIGATAACARLLGLTQGEAGHALAISISQAVAYVCQFGTDAKALQAGLGAKVAVVAAGLAKEGLTGSPSALDGLKGFGELTSDAALEDWEKAMSKIADPLAILEHGVAVKAYPNCGYTHRLTDCAREIFHSEGFSADEVVSIKTAQPDFHNAILVKKTPETLSEALMSVEMSIALALTKGTVTLSDWEQEVWRDQDLLQLMAKISVEPFRPINPELNFDPLQPDRLEVELQDGSVLMASCAFPLGAPQNPFTEEQAMEKFLNLLNQGNEGPSMFDQELVDQLASWDQSGDIISLLCPLG